MFALKDRIFKKLVQIRHRIRIYLPLSGEGLHFALIIRNTVGWKTMFWYWVCMKMFWVFWLFLTLLSNAWISFWCWFPFFDRWRQFLLLWNHKLWTMQVSFCCHLLWFSELAHGSTRVLHFWYLSRCSQCTMIMSFSPSTSPNRSLTITPPFLSLLSARRGFLCDYAVKFLCWWFFYLITNQRGK